MQEKELIMSYLAGVMDGDGSFSIIRLKKGSLNPLYAPMLQCCKWRREFIELLKETFGGNINKKKRILRKNGSLGHEMLRWTLRSSCNVKPALEKLLPYLKIKKEVAQVLLDFIDNCPFIRGQVLQQDQLQKRESLYLKAVQLNDWKTETHDISAKLARQLSDNVLFWSYIAGIMDTDGSFSVKKQVQNKGTDVRNPRYLPVISISMTDTRALNYLRENCNLGKIYVPRNKATRCGFHYQYGIYSKHECIVFINKILPYLRAKKEQARILLQFCEQCKNTGYCKAGIPDDELAFREQCHQEICQLNRDGVYKPSLIVLKTLTDDAEGNKEQAAKACSLNAVSEKAPLCGDAEL